MIVVPDVLRVFSMETLTLILFKERNIFQDKAKKQCWQIPSTANLTKTPAGWQEALAHSIQMALLQGQEQVLGWAVFCLWLSTILHK